MKTATLRMLAGVACGALVAGFAGAKGMSAKGAVTMKHEGSEPAPVERPALDTKQPARTERAVFALG